MISSYKIYKKYKYIYLCLVFNKNDRKKTFYNENTNVRNYD